MYILYTMDQHSYVCGSWSSFRRLFAQKVLYSVGSIFRRFIVPNIIYSEYSSVFVRPIGLTDNINNSGTTFREISFFRGNGINN